ncbi:MAG: FkbM family methyltransferase [Alphaproteobacteria bacterium]|nr:FkbM family methyltransferase [Alphaproteobacteria bacterium]
MPVPRPEFLQTPSGDYLVFPADFDIVQHLRETGRHDPYLVETAMRLLNTRSDWDTVLDIGAHLGTFCIPLHAARPCRIHAFEAQRPIAQLLGANFVINGVSQGWVHQVAVVGPDAPPFLELPVADFSAPGNFGAYSTDPEIARTSSALRLRYEPHTEQTPARTIDSYAGVGGFDRIGLIKIDVEGVELAVMQGSVETLRRNNYPPILFECWRDVAFKETRDATLRFARDLGYHCEEFGENIAATHNG